MKRSNPDDAMERQPYETWRLRVGALTGLPALVAELGADPAGVIAASGLPADALADADNRIPFHRFGRLLQAAADLTGRHHLGLIAGRMVRVDRLGIVGDLARNATSLAEALQFMVVYQHLNGEGDLVFVTRHEPIVEVGYAIYCPGVAGADHLFDYALAALFGILRELAGPHWLPSEVFLPHARPSHAVHYENLFRVLPRFGSESCSLRFPGYWLHRPVATADAARRRDALDAVQQAADADLLQQVYRALRELMLSGRSSGDDVADVLSMNRRTLNRRLRERGTTFQRVLDSARCEVARQLLAHSQLSVDAVAASLGYAGASPFTRSFRRWTASSPGDFRRLARAGKAHPASAQSSPGTLSVHGRPDSDPPSRRYDK